MRMTTIEEGPPNGGGPRFYATWQVIRGAAEYFLVVRIF
jgi:hypothetical protein